MQVGWDLLSAVAGVVLGCLTLPGLTGRVGLGATVAGACAVSATGFALLSRAGAGYDFADVLLPLLLIAFGCGVLASPVGFARARSGALPRGLNSSRQFGAGLGASLFAGIVTVAQQRAGALTFPRRKAFEAALSGAFRDCFELGTALCLTAAAIALLTLPRRGGRTTDPVPGVSGGAPAGTAGSPGSSAR
jgi:hypothetical protein